MKTVKTLTKIVNELCAVIEMPKKYYTAVEIYKILCNGICNMAKCEYSHWKYKNRT
ncbi:hypothetical protein J4468_04740 [Candidatus Woesearchaeota archaeon]|nr:hypothetical protein [Candidatus Woesearchaeota archaeon]